MHIRDGLLSPEVCVATGVLAAGALAFSVRQLRAQPAEQTTPLTGMLAACIFAGQMVNFPLFGLPVSGHLMGGVLAATLLGPAAGCLAISMVLVVQAILFADGGLLSLGANIVTMAVVGAWGGGVVVQQLRRLWGETPSATVWAALIAAYVSVLAAAGLFCLMFAGSQHASNVPMPDLWWWMMMYHSLIGLGEAAITGGVLVSVAQHRPEWLQAPARRPTESRLSIWGRASLAGAVIAGAIAALLGPWASSWPDGLEAAGERLGFNERGVDRVLVWSDYFITLPIDWESGSVAAAGLIGTGVVLLLGWLLTSTLRPNSAAVGDTPHVV
jgi:cobalt/nickel transport system permease protein